MTSEMTGERGSGGVVMNYRLSTHGELSRRLHKRFGCIKRVGYFETNEPGVVRLVFVFKWYVWFRRRKRMKVWRALETMEELPVGVLFRPAEMAVVWLEPSSRGSDEWLLKVYP